MGRKRPVKHRSGKVKGEKLASAEKEFNKGRAIFSLIFGVFTAVGFLYLFNALNVNLPILLNNQSAEGYSEFYWGMGLLEPFTEDTQDFLIMMIGGALVVAFLFYNRERNTEDSDMAYGQHGDSHFMKIDEIMNTFHSIPDQKKCYSGVGGVPVTHYKDRYYIDRSTVNTLFLGSTRSGKGETAIFPMIDILSRADEKSSMIFNDPKGELFAASKENLEKRGYDVLVLNLKSPNESMSFNPLQLSIDAYGRGDREDTIKRINTFTHSLFSKGMAGQNSFFYTGGKAVVNALCFKIIEENFEKTPEKITVYNVAQMLRELGSLNYTDENGKERNGLDDFMLGLPADDPSKAEYTTACLSGDKAKGNILATATTEINIFTNESFGKLTSKNCINLREIGFPKTFEFLVDKSEEKDLLGKRVTINFKRQKVVKGKEMGLQLIEEKDGKKVKTASHVAKIKPSGQVSLYYNWKLQNDDVVEIVFESGKQKQVLEYKMNFKADDSKPERYSGIDNKVELELLSGDNDLLGLHNLKMTYAEKPIALFMIVPDYDTSNHVLASIFISQLYTELAEKCGDAPGGKLFRRLHFILDEFGNMPSISDFDNIVTVCLGRNMLFNIFLQDFDQLKGKYPDGHQTIRNNCLNQILIFSTDDNSNEYFSKACGHRTVIRKNVSGADGKHYDGKNNLQKSAEKERLISPERVSSLLEGEWIVISNTRRNKNHEKVRLAPIFCTQKTLMPMRWEFFKDSGFEPKNDINMIDINCQHARLDLVKNSVDFAEYIKNTKVRVEYAINNGKDISEKDLLEYSKTEGVTKESYQKALKLVKDSRLTEFKIESIKIFDEIKEIAMARQKQNDNNETNNADAYINTIKERAESWMGSHIHGKSYYRYLSDLPKKFIGEDLKTMRNEMNLEFEKIQEKAENEDINFDPILLDEHLDSLHKIFDELNKIKGEELYSKVA